MTVVETNEDRAGYGYEVERHSAVPENVLPALTQREEAAAGSEGIKREAGPIGDILSKVGSDLDTKAVVETNGNKPSHGDAQHEEGGEKRTNENTPGPEIESRATQSAQDTVTISESDTTEVQVRCVRVRVRYV